MNITCEYCDKQFNRKSNYIRHIKTVHSRDSNGQLVSTQEKFTCTLCNKKYSAKNSLDYHVKSIHLEEQKSCNYCNFKTHHKFRLQKHFKKHEDDNKSFIKRFNCSYCNSSFRQESRLKFHVKVKHSVGEATFKAPICKKCPLCLFTAVGKGTKHITNHFKTSHNINLKMEKHTFASLEEFNDWKDGEEKKTVSFFYKKMTYIKNGISSVIYQCHRSGMYKTKGSNKRQIAGSCKINGFCPAAMKTEIDERGVHVNYISTHVGHKKELKHIRLTQHERKSKAIKLADGKLRNLRAAHKRSLLIANDQINFQGETTWQVLSSAQSEFYFVKKVKDCNSCQLQCLHCNTCFHEFVCTCLENSIKNNMCKHIHAVAKFSQTDVVDHEQDDYLAPLNVDLSPNEARVTDFIEDAAPVSNILDLDEYKQKFMEQMQEISNIIKSKDQMEWLNKETLRIKTAIMAMDPTDSSAPILKEPSVYN